jgi:hypothetical protein
MAFEEINRDLSELAKSLKEAQEASAKGDLAGSVRIYSRALEYCDKYYGDDHPDTLMCLHNLSTNHYALRNYKDAIPVLRRLLIGLQKTESVSADVASTMLKLSKCYDKLEQYSESEAFYRVTARMAEQVYGADSVALLTVLEGFLKALRRTPGRTKEADKLEQRLQELRGKSAQHGARDPSALLNHLADTIAPGTMLKPTEPPATPSPTEQKNASEQPPQPGLAKGLSIPPGLSKDRMPIDLSGVSDTPLGNWKPTEQRRTTDPIIGSRSQPDSIDFSVGRSSRDIQSTDPLIRGPNKDSQSTDPLIRNVFKDALAQPYGTGATSPDKQAPDGSVSSRPDGKPATQSGGLRFRDGDGGKPSKPTMNDSQQVAVMLAISLTGFLAFCIFAITSMKHDDLSRLTGRPSQIFSELFPDGLHKEQNSQPNQTDVKKTETPIYTTPDRVKQITILDSANALMTSNSINKEASYVASPPYLVFSPQGATASYSCQKTDDSLIEQNGVVLFAPWAPENTIITEMKVLAKNCSKYFRRVGHYPKEAGDLIDVATVISYQNPLTKEPVWPTKRTLPGVVNEMSIPNPTEVVNLQNAALQLHVWKPNETIEPYTVEFYHIQTDPGHDMIIVRGSDRTGHLLRSSTPGHTDMIVCVGGHVQE